MKLQECYDPTLITEPKTFHIQRISSLLGLKASCHSRGNLAFLYHRHLKSSSPQMPAQDKEIISKFFANQMIIEGSGK